MTSRMCDERFTKADRLRAQEDFQRVYNVRCRASDLLLVVHVRRNDLGRPRLGLSVPRRVGKAVVRNRWKRRLREAFRTMRGQLPQEVDVVVSPRPGEPPGAEQVGQSLVRLVHRAARKLR